jgi:hypothetical protein
MATIPTALRPRLSRRAVAILLVSTLAVPLVAAAGWIALSHNDALGEMELSASAGGVTIVRDGEVIEVDGNVDIEPGDLIRTNSTGAATFNLVGTKAIEMGRLTEALVLNGSSVSLARGQILARSKADEVRVVIGEIEATANRSHFRVDRSSTARIGVYEGTVSVSAPGEPRLGFGYLFQASIPLAAPEIPTQASPYRISAQDTWDGKYLNEVLELDRELKLIADGIANQFGPERPPLSYFSSVADRPVPFMRAHLNHRPANLLVALTIAHSAPGSMSAAFRDAIDLYEQGARWGVAAAILGAKPRPLLANINELVARSGLAGGQGAGSLARSIGTGSGPNGSQGGRNGAFGPGDGSDDPSDGPGGPGDPNDPTNDPPGGGGNDPKDPGEKPPEPPEECTNDIECTIQDIEPPVDNPLDDDVSIGSTTDGGGGEKDPVKDAVKGTKDTVDGVKGTVDDVKKGIDLPSLP